MVTFAPPHTTRRARHALTPVRVVSCVFSPTLELRDVGRAAGLVVRDEAGVVVNERPDLVVILAQDEAVHRP